MPSSHPDADLHPVATGPAKAIVDAHQAEQPLKLYAGWLYVQSTPKPTQLSGSAQTFPTNSLTRPAARSSNASGPYSKRRKFPTNTSKSTRITNRNLSSPSTLAA